MALSNALLLVLSLWVMIVTIEAVQYSPRVYGHLRAADLGKKATDKSCYYNIFLTNFDNTGYGGAFVSVQLNGNDVDGFTSPGITLPNRLESSGWTLPVTSGATLTVSYTAGLSHSGNGIMVTDANGNVILNETMADSTFTASLGHTSCDCVYETAEQCPSVRVRNEWRSLSFCSKQLFISALNKLRWTYTSEGENLYEQFIYHHKNVTFTVLERSLFLPWHRGFIWKFENALRNLGGEYSCLSLPYWDTSLDFGYESSSGIYDDLGGISYRSCMGYPFEDWTDPIPLGDDELTDGCVYRRAYPPDQQFAQFMTTTAADLGVVANDNYAYVFRYLVRDPHKSVHVYIAGSMATLHSPADPLFFLHHANIDRLYAMWQDCWDFDLSTDPDDQYAQVSAKADTPVDYSMPLIFPNASDPTSNWTIADSFDITQYSYRYTPVARSLVRLNTSYDIASVETCNWNWFSKSEHDANGWTYRLGVHTDEQRRRLSISRAAHQSHLDASSMDYYGAIRAQLGAECEMNGGYTAEDFNSSFMEQADSDHITGPGDMFKNACKLLQEGTLNMLIADCYPDYSC